MQTGRLSDRKDVKQACDMLVKNPRLRGYSIFPSGKSVFGHVPDYVQESARALELSWHLVPLPFSQFQIAFSFLFFLWCKGVDGWWDEGVGGGQGGGWHIRLIYVFRWALMLKTIETMSAAIFISHCHSLLSI